MRIRVAAVWCIFAGAFLLRFAGLDNAPLNFDEAYESLGGINSLQYLWFLPVSCLNGILLPAYPYLVSLARAFTVSPEWAVRLPAALAGGLTVVCLYHLTKGLYDRRAGLLAALLCCTLPWHVIQSRVGIPVVLAPLSGVLIFTAFLKAVRAKSSGWFLAAFTLVGVCSFYTYQGSVVLAIVFCACLWFLRKELGWVRRGTYATGILIALFFAAIPLYLQLTGSIQLFENFYRFYQRSPFQGNFLYNFPANIMHNAPAAFKALFFKTDGNILYAPSFRQPLLIHWAALLLLVWAAAAALYRRSAEDKLVLAWLTAGLVGSLAGVDVFAPRYIIILLPVFLIMLGRALAFLSERVSRLSASRACSSVLAACCAVILPLAASFQLGEYAAIAPFDQDECIQNSYGCREAAEFLRSIPDGAECAVISDMRVTVDCYLSRRWPDPEPLCPGLSCVYYVLWAPESHPKDYWKGQFSGMHESFSRHHPGVRPVKVITYPNGLPAIDIFRLETGK